MDWSWLILLMYPLMMIPMFFMMRGNHSGNSDQQSNKVNKELDAEGQKTVMKDKRVFN